MNPIPAGALDHNFEFFTHEGLYAFCLNHGKVSAFEEWPNELIDHIYDEMCLGYPDKAFYLNKMGVYGKKEMVRQLIICNYGAFDHNADMVDGKLQQPEYWDCPVRSSCKFDGKVCNGCKTDTGKQLTAHQVQILKYVVAGHANKVIAGMMGISKYTVDKHCTLICKKTGLFTKVDLTSFAYQKRIVQ
jgi:DNA-binding CsgD family transcriptional regulator